MDVDQFLSISESVSAEELAAGEVVVGLWLETHHAGGKTWEADQFQATYEYDTTGCADLSITKDDGATTFTRGSDITYEIVVSNAGPSDAMGAAITDSLPVGVTTASWTCGGATGGAICGAASGTGGISTTASLPASSSVTYSLALTVPPTYPGVNLTNTATVTAPDDVFDSDTSNNTASDTNSVSPEQQRFVCDSTMYLSMGGNPTQMVSVDTSDNPFGFPPFGDPAVPGFNGIGFDPNSNFIYATRWNSDLSRHRLLRIGADGSVRDLGNITGGGINVGVNQGSFATGVVGADGYFYVKHNGGSTSQFFRINLYNRTATSTDLTLSGAPTSIASADWAWHNNLLYAHDQVNDRLYTVDPSTGAVTIIGNSNTGGGFGSMISATNGVYGRDNNGGFYQFDTTTGEATLISDSPSGGGDGAKCPITAVELPADTQIAKDDGSTTYDRGGEVTYEIVVSNHGPFGVQNALVNDTLPDGLTGDDVIEWTCTDGANGGTCGEAGGTGVISDVPVSLPVDSSVEPPIPGTVTFTITMQVPLSFTGELTNTATVTNPPDVPDPESNNTASDTNIAAPLPTLTLAKTVVNDDVGTADKDDFPLEASGPTPFSGVSGEPAVTDVSVDPGTYTLTETTQPDYTASDYSCVVNGGAPVIGNSINLDFGDNAVCTITNDDNEPTDLEITKANGSETYNPGGQEVYTIVVTNNGPIDVVGALVNDAVPGPASGASWSCGNETGGASCGPISSGIGAIDDVSVNLPVDGTVTFEFTVAIPAGTEGELVNTATVTNPPETPDSNLSNNTAVDGDIYPLIHRDKSLAGEENGVIDGVAEPGETLTYRVEIENPETNGIVFDLTDDIDDITGYVAGSATVDGNPREPDDDGDPLQWIDLDVPAEQTIAVEYSVLVDDQLPDSVIEIRNAATSNCDAFPDVCTSTPTPGTAVPSKELTSEDGQVNGAAEPGETLTYTVTLTNSDAVDALYHLSDNIDDNTEYVTGSATVGGTDQEPDETGDPLVWNNLVVPAEGTLDVVYQVTVADPLPENVSEIGNIAYDALEPEPDCEDVPDQCVVLNAPAPELELEKSGAFEDANGNGVADPGEFIRYTFTVTNTGNVPLADVAPVDAGPTFNDEPAQEALSAFDPVSATVEPGSQQVFTASYPLTQIDIDNGAGVEDGVENTATAAGYAFGTRITGMPVESQESTVAVALPAAPSAITVIKVADIRVIRRGEQAAYTIRVTNAANTAARGMTVADTLPSGFRFVEGSATIGGVAVTPSVEGRQVIFRDVNVPPNGETEIRLRTLALSSAGPGEHVNRAGVTDSSGRLLAPEATATVEIVAEPVFDCSEIIGRVFDDRNRNGYQDEGESGLPGVRLATVNGELITTDAHGRFSVPCAALPDQRIGSNFILKLDTRTLPTGYRLTTANPRVLRLTAGKMTEFNFGASIGRVVRLDLQDAAFAPGLTELQPEWERGIDEVIAVLSQEQSVLRLTYVEAGGDPELAQDRLESLQVLIAERWRATSGQYRLEIEMRVETGQ